MKRRKLELTLERTPEGLVVVVVLDREHYGRVNAAGAWVGDTPGLDREPNLAPHLLAHAAAAHRALGGLA